MRGALFDIARCYLRRLHPLARTELARWHTRAAGIPDETLRRQAMTTLIDERSNAEGAALFASLAPPRWAPSLVRASVAYQVMYDYLDTVTEPAVPDHRADCELLHRAVVEALVPDAPTSDWYALHPSRDDGGYLLDLVNACRSACAGLPSHRVVLDQIARSARRSGEVQTLTHAAPDDVGSVRAWTAALTSEVPSLRWFEHAAGASSTLDIHTLLALAAHDDLTGACVATTMHHLTVLCALNTLLESLVDLPTDRRTGDYSYISHYASPRAAATRLGEIARQAVQTTTTTRRPPHHAAILIAMASLYLSRPQAWISDARQAALATFTELPAGRWPVFVLQLLRPLIPWA